MVSSEIMEVAGRVIAGLSAGTPLSVDFCSLTHHIYDGQNVALNC